MCVNGTEYSSNQIGPYSVACKLSRGGVGDVFQARDTRLVARGTMQVSIRIELLSIA